MILHEALHAISQGELSHRGYNISLHMPHAGVNVCPGRSRSQGSATYNTSRADEHTGVCIGGEFITKQE